MRDMASAISVSKGERGVWAKAISPAPKRAATANGRVGRGVARRSVLKVKGALIDLLRSKAKRKPRTVQKKPRIRPARMLSQEIAVAVVGAGTAIKVGQRKKNVLHVGLY